MNADDDRKKAFSCRKFKNIMTSMKEKLCDTPLGAFFNDTEVESYIIDINKLKKDLLSKAQQIYDKIECVGEKPKLTLDLIKVSLADGVKGAVMCCLCSIKNRCKNVKVFYQRTPRSGYWVASNPSNKTSHRKKSYERAKLSFEYSPAKQRTVIVLVNRAVAKSETRRAKQSGWSECQ